MYVLLNNLNSLSKSFVTNMFNVFDLLFMKWLSSAVTGTHSLNFSPSCCSTQHYSLSCIVTRFKPCGLTKYLVIHTQYNGLFSRGKNFSDVKENFHKWLVPPLYEAENMNFLREIIHELNPIHQIKKNSH